MVMFAQYFGGPTLGEFMVASSGMTTGKNEYFVRRIIDGAVQEPYDFEFFDDPVTVKRELERARLNRLSANQLAKLRDMERRGETRRNVRVVARQAPLPVELPHRDYRYYNKAQSAILYAPPRHAIFWRDEGDAVLTFKKNGRWYLHGVGGAPFFGREGITWQLVAAKLKTRYLPEGYILDSGAPCAFLREAVGHNELWFILGWTLTDAATRILKGVINHTMNIQSKDFERMPYPSWVPADRKEEAIDLVRGAVDQAIAGALDHPSEIVERLEMLYARDALACIETTAPPAATR